MNDAASAKPMNVRGSVVLARVEYVKERGMSEYARFLTSLSPRVRAMIEGGIAPERWVSLTDFLEVLEVLDRQLGAGDDALCYDMGRYSCDANMGMFTRFLLKLSSMEKLIARASEAWSVHYDAAKLVVVEQSDTRVVLRIEDHPDPHHAFCLSVKGWVVRAGELVGVRGIHATDETCRALGDPACELTFEWE